MESKYWFTVMQEKMKMEVHIVFFQDAFSMNTFKTPLCVYVDVCVHVHNAYLKNMEVVWKKEARVYGVQIPLCIHGYSSFLHE